MHHRFDNWLAADDLARCPKEIFRNCRLILYGHVHSNQALVHRNPSQSCLGLGANVSYTDNPKGFIGFQFIRANFGDPGVGVRVWPYYYDERDGVIKADCNRWETQQGQAYFDLDSFTQDPPGIGTQLPLVIPKIYKDWVEEFHATISFGQLAPKGAALPVRILDIYIPLETDNPFYRPDQEDFRIRKSKPNQAVDLEDSGGKFLIRNRKRLTSKS